MKRMVILATLALAAFRSFAADEEHVIFGRILKGTPISHTAYTCGYGSNERAPWWVSYRLTPEYCTGEKRLKEDPPFFVDPVVSNKALKSSSPQDYSDSRMWKLQMCPHGDSLGRSRDCETETFSLANVVAEAPNVQARKLWRTIEDMVRGWARQFNEVWVITGPIFDDAPERTSVGRIAIPKAFYKIVARKDGKSLKTVSFKVPQDAAGKPEMYLTNITDIEALTGLTFFPDLSSELANPVKAAKEMWSGSEIPGRGSGGGKAGVTKVDDGGKTEDGGVRASGGAAGQVWAMPRKGVYHSRNSTQFGIGDGKWMDEDECRALGFRKIK